MNSMDKFCRPSQCCICAGEEKCHRGDDYGFILASKGQIEERLNNVYKYSINEYILLVRTYAKM